MAKQASDSIMLTLLVILGLMAPFSDCTLVQINNIHTGYKTVIKGEAHVYELQEGTANIHLKNAVYEMNQLESELIPFVETISDSEVAIRLKDLTISHVFEEDGQKHIEILLSFDEVQSIVVTFSLKESLEFDGENLAHVATVIKADCRNEELMGEDL